MAIPFDVLKKKDGRALEEEELKIVALVEAYIDSELEHRYKGEEVSIPMRICEFVPNAITKDVPGVNDYSELVNDLSGKRKKIMSDTLRKRYEDVGWEIQTSISEDDGPNRPGIDYWVFNGK